ncbi:hypothetical protein TWF281_006149 [Arthrobotrys megalospora]
MLGIPRMSLFAAGLFLLLPISIIYTFHSINILDPDLTTIRVTVPVGSEHVYHNESLQKRAENFEPGTFEEFATKDVWNGAQISNRCSQYQKARFQKGWFESGYLARVFRLSLEELKFERALGDYLGGAWKTSPHSQRIIENFGRVESLHSGGTEFGDDKLEVYCDEDETPRDKLEHCDGEKCCDDQEGEAGGYFYMNRDAGAKTMYAIVLCPKYFEGQLVQERAGILQDLGIDGPGIDELKKNIWALYPNIGSMLLHLQLHFPLITKSLYVGDARDYYNPIGSGRIAAFNPDLATRTAENYAMAALAAAQVHIFGLEKAPFSDENQEINGVRIQEIFKKAFGERDERSKGQENQPKLGPKPVPLVGSKPGELQTDKTASGFSPAFNGGIISLKASWANYTLPPLPGARSSLLPTDLHNLRPHGLPSFH